MWFCIVRIPIRAAQPAAMGIQSMVSEGVRGWYPGVSGGGILGYPGVSGVSAHHLAHCCPPNGTNYNDSRHAKGYPGWGKQMLYNIRGSATTFRSSMAHLRSQHCMHASRIPSPPRALHSRILQDPRPLQDPRSAASLSF